VSKVHLFVSKSKEVQPGSFIVARITSPPLPGENYGPNNIQEVYWGDCSRADALMGWGIMRQLIDKEGSTMIIFSQDDDVPESFNNLPEIKRSGG
jgi:hypothetical protein